MEENIIVKSEQYSVKKLFRALIIIGSLILLFFLIWQTIDYLDYLDTVETWRNHDEHGEFTCYHYEYNSIYGKYEKVFNCPYSHKPTFYWNEFLPFGVVAFVSLILLAFILKFWLSSYEMVVTDKRIYGKVAWGKRVDLPFDSISATSTLRLFKGVSVSSASGRIKFLLIKNASEMYNEINKLLIERQKKETPANINVENKSDTPNDLIKLKELLDMEIITQEEFDAKKKQILGL